MLWFWMTICPCFSVIDDFNELCSPSVDKSCANLFPPFITQFF